ncbi:MAG: hypothetical protein ACYSUK_06395 [Planctomycetota bacterium]|jgi:hypothetical protein
MPIKEKVKHILAELKGHAPFTIFGAFLGILFMLLFKNLTQTGSQTLFAIFHPAHVLLSAVVTASMFRIHTLKKQILLVFIIGYIGSIGVATLSDIIIPHIGSDLLGLDIPAHSEVHQHTQEHQEYVDAETDQEHKEERIHLGFIEEWYIVNPAALLGILLAYFLPRTKFPHAGHVLISTWASSSYLLMTLQAQINAFAVLGILVTLFIATWLPCCISDIIFPLLFVKSDLKLVNVCACSDHVHHSHPHEHEHAEDCEVKGQASENS